MPSCPICKTPLEDNAVSCHACGYRFHETTQEFKPVALTEQQTAAQKTTNQEAALVICSGRQKGMTYKLTHPKITVGRSPKCDVFLNDMTVSRDHAVLEEIDRAWTIQDNASFNGVWVNNKNIDHVVLHNGDLIQIGSFILKFVS